jgi:transcriptional regulator with XRE-family HTH domain
METPTQQNRIKELCARRGISMYKLAQLIGKKPHSVSRYANDLRSPNLATVKQMCEALGCSKDELYPNW